MALGTVVKMKLNFNLILVIVYDHQIRTKALYLS